MWRQVLEPSLAKGNRVMVFCNTLNSSRAVDHFLAENQISTVNYHGEVPAEQRLDRKFFVPWNCYLLALHRNSPLPSKIRYTFLHSSLQIVHILQRKLPYFIYKYLTCLWASKGRQSLFINSFPIIISLFLFFNNYLNLFLS